MGKPKNERQDDEPRGLEYIRKIVDQRGAPTGRAANDDGYHRGFSVQRALESAYETISDATSTSQVLWGYQNNPWKLKNWDKYNTVNSKETYKVSGGNGWGFKLFTGIIVFPIYSVVHLFFSQANTIVLKKGINAITEKFFGTTFDLFKVDDDERTSWKNSHWLWKYSTITGAAGLLAFGFCAVLVKGLSLAITLGNWLRHKIGFNTETFDNIKRGFLRVWDEPVEKERTSNHNSFLGFIGYGVGAFAAASLIFGGWLLAGANWLRHKIGFNTETFDNIKRGFLRVWDEPVKEKRTSNHSSFLGFIGYGVGAVAAASLIFGGWLLAGANWLRHKIGFNTETFDNIKRGFLRVWDEPVKEKRTSNHSSFLGFIGYGVGAVAAASLIFGGWLLAGANWLRHKIGFNTETFDNIKRGFLRVWDEPVKEKRTSNHNSFLGFIGYGVGAFAAASLIFGGWLLAGANWLRHKIGFNTETFDNIKRGFLRVWDEPVKEKRTSNHSSFLGFIGYGVGAVAAASLIFGGWLLAGANWLRHKIGFNTETFDNIKRGFLRVWDEPVKEKRTSNHSSFLGFIGYGVGAFAAASLIFGGWLLAGANWLRHKIGFNTETFDNIKRGFLRVWDEPVKEKRTSNHNSFLGFIGYGVGAFAAASLIFGGWLLAGANWLRHKIGFNTETFDNIKRGFLRVWDEPVKEKRTSNHSSFLGFIGYGVGAVAAASLIFGGWLLAGANWLRHKIGFNTETFDNIKRGFLRVWDEPVKEKRTSNHSSFLGFIGYGVGAVAAASLIFGGWLLAGANWLRHKIGFNTETFDNIKRGFLRVWDEPVKEKRTSNHNSFLGFIGYGVGAFAAASLIFGGWLLAGANWLRHKIGFNTETFDNIKRGFLRVWDEPVKEKRTSNHSSFLGFIGYGVGAVAAASLIFGGWLLAGANWLRHKIGFNTETFDNIKRGFLRVWDEPVKEKRTSNHSSFLGFIGYGVGAFVGVVFCTFNFIRNVLGFSKAAWHGFKARYEKVNNFFFRDKADRDSANIPPEIQQHGWRQYGLLGLIGTAIHAVGSLLLSFIFWSKPRHNYSKITDSAMNWNSGDAAITREEKERCEKELAAHKADYPRMHKLAKYCNLGTIKECLLVGGVTILSAIKSSLGVLAGVAGWGISKITFGYVKPNWWPDCVKSLPRAVPAYLPTSRLTNQYARELHAEADDGGRERGIISPLDKKVAKMKQIFANLRAGLREDGYFTNDDFRLREQRIEDNPVTQRVAAALERSESDELHRAYNWQRKKRRFFTWSKTNSEKIIDLLERNFDLFVKAHEGQPQDLLYRFLNEDGDNSFTCVIQALSKSVSHRGQIGPIADHIRSHFMIKLKEMTADGLDDDRKVHDEPMIKALPPSAPPAGSPRRRKYVEL